MNHKARVIACIVALAFALGGLAAIPAATAAPAAPGPIFEPIASGLANVPKVVKFERGPTTINLQKATIPVLGEVPWHCHPGPTTFIVVQGQLTTFNADGTSVVLEPGDADVELVGQARMSVNTGDVDVIVYIQFAPPEGMAPTIWLTGPADKCPL